MKSKRIVKPKSSKDVQKPYNGPFSTIKFVDKTNGKLFECIPDIWFVDENKDACFWPPKTGKSFSYRALNGEIPDETLEVFACEIVSEGHPTHSSGFKVVREKCSQKYNTSSADKEIQAAMFRRKHPGLIMRNQKGFEQIFDEQSQGSDKPNKEQETCSTTNDETSTSNCENQSEQMDNQEQFDNTQQIKSGDLRLSDEKNQTLKDKTSPSNDILPDHSLRSASLDRSSRSRPRSKQSHSSNIIRTSSASSFHCKSSEDEQTHCSKDLSSRNRLKVAVNSRKRSLPLRCRSTTRSRSKMRSRSRSSHSSHRTSPTPTFRRNSSQEQQSRNSKDLSSSNRSNVAVTNKEKASHSNGRTRSRSTTRSKSKIRSRSRLSHSSYSSRASPTPTFSRNSSQEQQSRSSRNRSNVAVTNKEKASHSNGRKRSCSTTRSQSKIRSRSRLSHSSYSSRASPTPTFRRNSSQEQQSRNSKDLSSRNRSNIAVSNKEKASHSNGRKTSCSTTRSRSKMRSRSRSRSSTHRTCPNLRKPYSNIRRHHQSNSSVNSRSSSKSSTNGYGKRNGRSASKSTTASFVSRTRQSSVARRYIHQRESDTRASSNTHRRVSDNSYKLSHAQQSHAMSSNTYNAHGTNLLALVQNLTKSVEKINGHLSANDQRFDRMEVTVNKMFVLLGDMAHGRHSPMHINDASENDEDFDVPNLPIKHTDKLAIFQSKLKNKDFRNFLIKREKEFCSPSGRQTDTVTMTKHLQRFITLRVRCKLTLKDKGESGITLFDNYNRVYLFLIDVMKEGYKLRNKKNISDDAHQALRIVSGRSRQLRNEEEKKLANKEKKKRSKK